MNSTLAPQVSRVMDAFTHTLLPEARMMLGTLEGGHKVAMAGGAFGDLTNDTVLRADNYLGLYLGNAAAKMPEVGHVSVEGMDDVTTGHGKLWVAIDPLDGSLNYRDHGPVAGFPFTACVTVLRKKKGATFHDIVAAAVIDLRNGDLWSAMRDDKGQFQTLVNGQPAHVQSATELDLGKMVVLAELYYIKNRELATVAFRDMKGWLRSPGSAAYEMASVASGQAAASFCVSQKQHEGGAGYALVLGAGGVVTDLDGQSLGPRPYTFKDQTPMILAANSLIGLQLIRRLKDAKKDLDNR